MLFVLTGDIQIGKSRWLEDLIERLSAVDVECYGVISKGVWIKSDSPQANNDGYEKVGINSILLPAGDEFCFAQRLDLAKQSGFYKENSQAAKIGLGWHISDDALARVNEHFARLICKKEPGEAFDDSFRKSPQSLFGIKNSLLIVDEFGRLEMEKGGGLVCAMKALDNGADDHFKDALVVARDVFSEQVSERFGRSWGGVRLISPDENSMKLVLETIAL